MLSENNATSTDKRRVSGAVRLFGVNILAKKNIRSGLPLLYGIGKRNVFYICYALGINPYWRFCDLEEDQLSAIRKHIESNYKIEGDLRGEINNNIKQYVSMGCHRGLMHKSGLPVRGQRTRTNARTRKGPKKSFGKK